MANTLKAVPVALMLTLAVRAADLPPASYVTADEIQTALKQAPANAATYDKLIKTVPGPGYKVSVAILRRTSAETTALIHPKVTEVYEMLTGAGTLETGGSLLSQTPTDLTAQAAGPSFRGNLQGGESRHIGPGDVAVVLPSVPHRFSKLEGTVTYLVTRIEATER